MFWSVVGRILWARRLIVAVVTLGSLAGGAIIAASATPLYDATARVMLNISQPDPITGASLNRRSINPYLQTQLSLIRDYQVVIPAIEAVGWLDNPDIIAAYNERPPTDRRPLPLWLAGNVIDSLQTSLVEDSNIIEIRYRGETPQLAELVVGAIRDAYIAANIRQRRQSAMEDADFQDERAGRLRMELIQLQARKHALEAETGIVLARSGTDVDGDKLLALAQPGRTAGGADPPPIFARAGSVRATLSTIEMEIAAAAEVLGPNHPQLVELRATRDALALQARAEDRSAGGVTATVLAREQAKQAQFEAQRAKVLSQRQDVLRLRLLQDQINLKAKALEAATERVANARQLATAIESGLTSIGRVESEDTPAFPNLALVLGGTGGLGLLAGLIIAFLVEMLNLRVRTVMGLKIATNLPIIGAVSPLREPATERGQRRVRIRKLKPVTT